MSLVIRLVNTEN